MNKWQIEVQKSLLKSEAEAVRALESQYKRALSDINLKVRDFQAEIDLLDAAINQDGVDNATRALLQSQRRSKIYQKQYQEALKSQVSGILDKMRGDNYSTIESYLKDSYESGYVGTMYDIAKQGIPIITPMNQAAAVRAILVDSKVSGGLYKRLGIEVFTLKKAVTQEISRGIATGLGYGDIARNIANATSAPFSRTKTIARTEGHRIQQTSTADAQRAAKDRGADVVKQWDSTLDGKTRESHRRVDGEIRELDETFSNGLMYPGDPKGAAAEVINCRCACLTRARWALDEEELEELKQRAEFFGLDKTENFEEFKAKFLEAAEEESKNRYDSTAVSPVVKTSGYRNLYNNLDESVDIQRTACKKAREMLAHRSGTKFEDMTFINTVTGEALTRTDYEAENQVLPSKRMRRMVSEAEPHTVIAIHNHPGSSVPSITDLETAYEKRYKYGLIVCHNGYVMRYRVLGEFNEVIVDQLLDKANKYLYNGSETTVRLEAMLDLLKAENVELEVFRE